MNTLTTSDMKPLVMNVFEPLRIQSSPSRRAVVLTPCRSLEENTRVKTVYAEVTGILDSDRGLIHPPARTEEKIQFTSCELKRTHLNQPKLF